MKKTFVFITLLFSGMLLFAQTDNYSYYLDQAKQQLADGECKDAWRNYGVYNTMTETSVPSLEQQIQACFDEKKQKESQVKEKVVYVPAQSQETKPAKKKKDLMDNSYCNANKNRYVAWGIAGAGYPWNLVTSIEFRAGGIVGVGLYGDIGMDFTACEYSSTLKKYTETAVAFRYAGGVKFFPYKGLFIDGGYGTISKPTYSGAKTSVKNSHGVLFHAGYNLVTNLSGTAGFFLGVSGGASYDVINKVFAPSVNLKIGVAFGWQK